MAIIAIYMSTVIFFIGSTLIIPAILIIQISEHDFVKYLFTVEQFKFNSAAMSIILSVLLASMMIHFDLLNHKLENII